MQAKIVIERHVVSGRESQALDIAVEMRSVATKQLGYISGETLIDTEDHGTMIVVSTWRSVQDWKRWESNEDRLRIEGYLAPLLSRPAIVRVCADAGEFRAGSEGSSAGLYV